MKLLKIEENVGLYLDVHNDYVEVNRITKEDLLRLVDLTLRDDVEFDEYSDGAIKNQAHQIVYRNIYEKLRDLKGRKEEFIDQSERLYLEEYEKYRDQPSQQADPPEAENGVG